jgi:hypothetical protein
VDPRAGLQNMDNRKFLTLPGLKPTPDSSRTASFYSGCSIPASVRQYREANVDNNLHRKGCVHTANVVIVVTCGI